MNLNVFSAENQAFVISIENLLGQTMLQFETTIETSDKIQIPVQNLPAGQYLIRITANGISETRKVVILQ